MLLFGGFFQVFFPFGGKAKSWNLEDRRGNGNGMSGAAKNSVGYEFFRNLVIFFVNSV